MWPMFLQTVSLFLKGKMFRDPKQVFLRSAMGVAAGVILLVLLGKFVPAIPLWASAMAAGVVTGLLMPYLFKDLKYA